MTPDPKELAATYAAAFPHTRPWTAKEIADIIGNNGAQCIGDGTCFLIAQKTIDEVEILTLATHPDFRRRGRAKDVLTALEQKIRGSVQSIFLEVDETNSAARALYHSCAYRQIGLRRGYYVHTSGPATNALVLRKTVD